MMTKTRFLHLREILSQLASPFVLVGAFHLHDWWRGRVRAYACNRESGSIDDFCILEDGPVVHVCNAPHQQQPHYWLLATALPKKSHTIFPR